MFHRTRSSGGGRRRATVLLLLFVTVYFAVLGSITGVLATRPIDKDDGRTTGGDHTHSGGGSGTDHGCDPLSFPYKTLAYRNPRDCRTYTLFDLDAGCLPNWFAAREMCERRGLELAPKGDREAEASATKLCADNDFTCWLGGKCDPGLCNLMSQDGDLHKQGCHQPVRFVCREKKGSSNCESRRHKSPPPPSSPRRPPRPPPGFEDCYSTCRWENPWCDPYMRFCDKYGTQYEDYCWAMCSFAEGPLYECPGRKPPPPPPPPPAVSRRRPPGTPAETDPNVLSKSADGYDYRMYDKNASRQMSYNAAAKFCKDLGDGWDLVPYWDNKGYEIVRQLCAELNFTCWLKSKETDAQCALMAADGSRQMQGCEQDVRFVCRRSM